MAIYGRMFSAMDHIEKQVRDIKCGLLQGTKHCHDCQIFGPKVQQCDAENSIQSCFCNFC